MYPYKFAKPLLELHYRTFLMSCVVGNKEPLKIFEYKIDCILPLDYLVSLSNIPYENLYGNSIQYGKELEKIERKETK